jgi:hypothetical protein
MYESVLGNWMHRKMHCTDSNFGNQVVLVGLIQILFANIGVNRAPSGCKRIFMLRSPTSAQGRLGLGDIG